MARFPTANAYHKARYKLIQALIRLRQSELVDQLQIAPRPLDPRNEAHRRLFQELITAHDLACQKQQNFPFSPDEMSVLLAMPPPRYKGIVAAQLRFHQFGHVEVIFYQDYVSAQHRYSGRHKALDMALCGNLVVQIGILQRLMPANTYWYFWDHVDDKKPTRLRTDWLEERQPLRRFLELV